MRMKSLLLTAVLLLLVTSPALAQVGTLYVENDRVGIGVEHPARTLHVEGSDGQTRLYVRETAGTEAERYLLQLENNGVTMFQLRDTSPDGALWNFEAEGPSFRFNKAGSGGDEVILRQRFDAGGQPTMTVNGSLQATNVSFTSSREFKTGFTAVDGTDVLSRIAALPITEWSFKAENNGRRHIGPVAEEFNAAFGLAGSGTEISLIDANGIALAGIQALHTMVEEKDATIDALQAQNAELEKRLAALEQAVGALVD